MSFDPSIDVPMVRSEHEQVSRLPTLNPGHKCHPGKVALFGETVLGCLKTDLRRDFRSGQEGYG